MLSVATFDYVRTALYGDLFRLIANGDNSRSRISGRHYKQGKLRLAPAKTDSGSIHHKESEYAYLV